jgi:predicted transcriptional regulator
MGRNKKDERENLLTPLELEVMTQLWKSGGASAHEVLEMMPEEYAYTTISTVLRILLQKGAVEAQPSGRQHVYKPVIDKDDYESSTLKHVVTTVFDGEPASLMRRLLNDKVLSKKELDEIRALLSEKSGERKT